jgi:hypothetical protein
MSMPAASSTGKVSLVKNEKAKKANARFHWFRDGTLIPFRIAPNPKVDMTPNCLLFIDEHSNTEPRAL